MGDGSLGGLKPYPEMRGSGVPWLGPVPKHWGIRRFKYLLRERDSRSPDGSEQLLRVSQYTGVTERRRDDGGDEPDTRAASLVGYKQVDPNELVVNIMLAWNGSLGVSSYAGITSPAYCVYKFGPDLEPWYFHHLLRSPTFRAKIKSVSTGVVDSRLRLYSDALYRLEAIIPPPAEQAAIVRFIDHVDRKIRKYIRAKQKLIKLLEEQKQAIIHRAVTRGLDPNERLKPSGVDWLGDVPEHWQVVRLKFATTAIVDCLHATPKYSDAGQFPAIRTADVSPGVVRVSSAKRVDGDEFRRWTQRLEPTAGDILYSREGERFGIAACVPNGTRLCISQRMMVFRPSSEHDSTFLMWALNSQQVYAQACQDVMGATAPHVNVGTIRNYQLSLPDRDEQVSIVRYIESSTAGFETAIAAAVSEIELLREYRVRLVADVVTGKVDVREAGTQFLNETDESLEFGDELTNGEMEAAEEHAEATEESDA